MLKDLRVKVVTVLLIVSLALVVPAVIYAITWTYLGQISGQAFYSPTSSGMWAGYTEISTYRYIYASHDTFTYGNRVDDIQNAHNLSGGLEFPALDFDDKAQNNGFHTALHATAWYQTNAPVYDHWRFDDNGDGRREQVRLAFYPPRLSAQAHYYYDQQYQDLNFPYRHSEGEINVSAYWVWSWGGRISSEWMCKFFYEDNNTFSRQCP